MIIYHYTDPNGFRSIIQHKKIWISNSKGMNDLAEGSYLGIKARDKYISAIKSIIPDNQIKGFVLFYDDVIRGAVYYLTSFSENGDLLDQWRAYAGDGQGFSIGIEVGPIVGSEVPPYQTADSNQKPALVKCRYSNEEMSTTIETILNTDYPGQNAEFKASMWANEIARLGILCKHPAFINEREIRLVYRPVRWPISDRVFSYRGSLGSPSWRTGKFGLIPYFEFPIEPDDIKSIVIGPNANNFTISMCEQFLQDNGVFPAIRRSECPYRA